VRDAARVLKGHVGQYIFISTISVYAANDKSADETATLVPTRATIRWPRQSSR
jgi:2'-hydroxyisoflavone reductase